MEDCLLSHKFLYLNLQFMGLQRLKLAHPVHIGKKDTGLGEREVLEPDRFENMPSSGYHQSLS